MKRKIFLTLILSAFILTACNDTKEVSDVEEQDGVEENMNEDVVDEHVVTQKEIELFVNVPAILGLTKEELVNVMGEPEEVLQDSTEVYVYENIEVGFDNGIAATFYYEPTNFEFPIDNELILKSLGFEGFKEVSNPIESPNRAYELEGYEQISLFGKFDKPLAQYDGEIIPIDYVYIKN